MVAIRPIPLSMKLFLAGLFLCALASFVGLIRALVKVRKHRRKSHRPSKAEHLAGNDIRKAG
jgi:hypothetical protein